MLTFKEIVVRLAHALDIKDPRDLREVLDYNTQNSFNKALQNDATPLKKILDICIDKHLDATDILYGDHSGKEIISKIFFDKVNPKHHHIIPFFPDVNASCGDGCINDTAHSNLILLPRDRYPYLSDGVEAINALGDSMAPLIPSHSIILFQRMEDIEDFKNSGIYLYRYNEELFIKILTKDIKDIKKVNSISLNPLYSTRVVEKEKIQIIGEFVSTI